MVCIPTVFDFAFEAAIIFFCIEHNTVIKMQEGRGGEQKKYGTGDIHTEVRCQCNGC